LIPSCDAVADSEKKKKGAKPEQDPERGACGSQEKMGDRKEDWGGKFSV